MIYTQSSMSDTISRSRRITHSCIYQSFLGDSFVSSCSFSRRGSLGRAATLWSAPAPRMPYTMKGQPFYFASLSIAAAVIVAFFGIRLGGCWLPLLYEGELLVFVGIFFTQGDLYRNKIIRDTTSF
jgi:hypothetical protein